MNLPTTPAAAATPATGAREPRPARAVPPPYAGNGAYCYPNATAMLLPSTRERLAP